MSNIFPQQRGRNYENRYKSLLQMFENRKENIQLYKYLPQAKHGILYASHESEIGNKTRNEIRN